MVKRIATRLAALEARLIRPPQPVCPECDKEGDGPFIWETHHEDGVVSYDPKRPCKGCAKIARARGLINHITICPHGCWCEKDQTKVEAAPTVVPGMSEYEHYEDGAAKYHRLREKHLLEEGDGNGLAGDNRGEE